jgi:hypothetical protein
MALLNIELASVEIMAKELLTYIKWLSFRHHRTIFGNSNKNLIKLYQYGPKLGSTLYLACLDGGTWQVITILARIAMKTDAHVQPAPIT